MQNTVDIANQNHKKSSPPHSLSKTKTKFKISKAIDRKQNQNRIVGNYHLPFNDPLYQYLDGEVHNKEEHNFGPWVSLERIKTREKQRQNRAVSQLSPIRAQQTFARYQQQPEITAIQEEAVLPVIMQRISRGASQHELKSSYLQLDPIYDSSVQKRKQIHSLNKKQLFFRWKDAPFLYTRSSLELPYKKSNVIYNYCLHQQQDNPRLKPGLKLTQSYMRITLQKKLQPMMSLARLDNQNLVRELKEHRINKLK